MAGLGLAKKVGLTALGLGTGGAAGNIELDLQVATFTISNPCLF